MNVLDPALVRDRLQAHVPALRFAGLAADLGRVNARSLLFPSAFVILLGEQAGDPRYAGPDTIDQAVTARIGVILAVRDIADASGATAAGALTPLRAALLGALTTYAPETGGQAFRFARGALQSGIDDRGALFWQDDFTLRFDRRIQIT
ncbi:hypothetical protein RGUI_0841 [Rhodovulum sp. P5]|uniref:phage tail terminator protein n=1 Tax=Rhodovulum sp. P5 TaxID=1564506 RepID=UPI00080ABE10|nr:hypothetical protein [Rhodovulum sp. P5]YP_009285928.1 hypothetical protein BI026_gp43 [Rhodovulum phage vB_RhkS_P1]ANT39914.1 hypothetical protein Rhks_43 [Rhodovulum phage vB_RhkS_P1]ARE38982.1 hypothetical protein RGUI_0841 [Rhodovulum sp. P5]